MSPRSSSSMLLAAGACPGRRRSRAPLVGPASCVKRSALAARARLAATRPTSSTPEPSAVSDLLLICALAKAVDATATFLGKVSVCSRSSSANSGSLLCRPSGCVGIGSELVAGCGCPGAARGRGTGPAAADDKGFEDPSSLAAPAVAASMALRHSCSSSPSEMSSMS